MKNANNQHEKCSFISIEHRKKQRIPSDLDASKVKNLASSCLCIRIMDLAEMNPCIFRTHIERGGERGETCGVLNEDEAGAGRQPTCASPLSNP
jgi:hypothetical protein